MLLFATGGRPGFWWSGGVGGGGWGGGWVGGWGWAAKPGRGRGREARERTGLMQANRTPPRHNPIRTHTQQHAHAHGLHMPGTYIGFPGAPRGRIGQRRGRHGSGAKKPCGSPPAAERWAERRRVRRLRRQPWAQQQRERNGAKRRRGGFDGAHACKHVRAGRRTRVCAVHRAREAPHSAKTSHARMRECARGWQRGWGGGAGGCCG